ncbi:phosphoribosyltransferase [Luteolibacter yonseiensis]|uniref:Phosphoribosyltransferase n=1 Tax=Luteolibacter yonseiensis TaxID=1144680 RepID=A0A934R5S1_9BACT|nr:phosphoribosyltransferase [Luteolibacter yonseiensis]MBK1817497.1 phosphoribosyltransferase [Luteolibacter yonseiensis]
MPLPQRSRFRADVQAALDEVQVAPDRPAIDIPKAQTLTRSANNPDAQRVGNAMLREDERQREDAIRQGQMQQRRSEAEARRAANEQASTDKQARAMDVRAGAAAGQKNVTDIATGERTIARHNDGAPVYDTGKVGTPTIQPTPAEQVSTVPGVGGIAQLNRPAGDQTAVATQAAQTYRNDRGSLLTAPLPSKTDAKTGETRVTTDDEFGRPQQTATGVDPVAEAKAMRDAEFQQRRDQLALKANGIAQQRMRFDEPWKKAKGEFDDVTRELEKSTTSPKFVLNPNTGAMEKYDPDTGFAARDRYKQPIPYDSYELAKWQQDQRDLANRYAAAKTAHDKLSPYAESLNRAEENTKLEHLKLRAEQIAHELPGIGPEATELLARSEPDTVDPDQENLSAVLPPDISSTSGTNGIPATAGANAGAVPSVEDSPENRTETAQPKPVIAPDTRNPDAVLKAFSGLQGVEGMTLEPSAAGSFINRGGKWIGTIQDGGADGQKVIVLRDDARTDDEINKTVALGVTSGAPVYLRDDGQKKDIAKEAQYLASVFQTRLDPTVTSPRQMSARIAQLGADKASIKAKVNAGELSIQSGEALMQELYSDTLKPTPLSTPQSFGKWLQDRSKAENDASIALRGKPAAETVQSRWSNRTNLADRQEVKREYLRDWFSENRGKPGVTRASIQKLYGKDVADEATTGERIQSALKTGGRMIRDDVAGSMIGLAGKFAVGLGAAEASLFGSEDGKRVFNELLTSTNRDTANWVEGAKRNAKIWTTKEGAQISGQLNNAVRNFKRTIDEEFEKPAPDQGKVDAANQAVIQAALALHGLSPDPSWPITADSLDANKDPALASALVRYAQTADPREMELFKERLLMSNGRRQFSAEMEKKTAGMGKFGGSVIGGMHAGWQEVATEMVADAGMLVTAGGSKAVQAGLKGVGMASKASMIARIGERAGALLDDVARAGIKAESLVNPLTRTERAMNGVVGFGKTAAGSAVGEGFEEVLSEIGADSPNLPGAFASGTIGAVALVPIAHFGGQAVAGIPERAQTARRDALNAKWTRDYNASMADLPGFKAISPEQAMLARAFVDPARFEQTAAAIEENRQKLEAFTGEGIDGITPEDLETVKGQARQMLDRSVTDLATQTQEGIAAVNEIYGIEDPEQRTYFQGIAKVATGNEAALTSAERSAIQGGTTPDGKPLFAEIPQSDGMVATVLTDDARAFLRVDMPAVGNLVRTTESDAIYDALSQPTTQPSYESNPQASENLESNSIPAPTPEGMETGPDAEGNAGFDVDGNAPLRPSQEAPAQSQVNFAELDAAEYEAARQTDPSLPDIPSVVKQSLTARRPVSVSMAKAAGIEMPEGYTRRGHLLTPPVPEPQNNSGIISQEKVVPGDESPTAQEEPTQPSETVQKAAAAVQRASARYPSLRGLFLLDESGPTGQTGGAYATPSGAIVINSGDLERELSGFSPDNQDSRVDAIIDEEIIHLAQFEAVRNIGEDVQEFYGQLWDEFTPEQQTAAAHTYQASFENKESWAKAAETVRMLVQQRADGQVTELTKAFSKDMPARLVEMLRRAVEFLKSVVAGDELSQRVKDAIDGIESILAEYSTSDAPTDANRQSEAKLDVQTGQSDTQVAEILPETASDQFSPMRVTGEAIRDAVDRDSRLTPARKRDLDFAMDEIWDLLETLPPEQRREFTDNAINEWLDSLPPAKEKKARSIDSPARREAYKILNSDSYPALSKIFQSGTKLAPRPNLISLVLAKRKSGGKLSNREIELVQNNPEYDGALFQNQFANSGKGKVAREILSLITARQGEGSRPDVVAGYVRDGMTASDMWGELWKELNAIANGTQLDGEDPNRDFSDEDIAAELAKPTVSSLEKVQREAFDHANTPDNGEPFAVEDFTPEHVGSTVTVDGEEMRITAVEMDSLGIEVESVILDDHLRFGRQILDGGDVIYLENPDAPAYSAEVDEEALFSSPSAPRGRAAPVDIPNAIVAHDLGKAAKHPDYAAAKAGDPRAALRLARDLVTKQMRNDVAVLIGDSKPVIVPVIAMEAGGNNKIPHGVAIRIEESLGLQSTTDIIQSVKAHRSEKTALDRVFAQPSFSGPVKAGESYLLVDDTLTQGGTFAALADHIARNGGKVVGAVALTGKQYSATLRLSEPLLAQLRNRLGDLEDTFKRATGHGFESLTESEARTLVKFGPVDRVRERITKEGIERGDGVDAIDEGQADSPLAASPSNQRTFDFEPAKNNQSTVAGAKVDSEWSLYNPRSGTLGVPRAEMPQVKADNRSALVQYLRARGVDYEAEEVLPGTLKPTQAEYSPSKVRRAREFDGGNRSILVSADHHVVDGHHQWMVKLADAPKEPMPVIRLKAPIAELLPMIKEMPSSTTAAGAPSSKMDTRNADSKELFPDDGGFQLTGEKTVDGEKVTAAKRAAEAAKASQDAAQGTLFSSPSPDQSAAVQAALAAMPPIYRDVFASVSAGDTPAQVFSKFNLNEIKVKNILNSVRSKITAAMGAASAEGLVPVMKDGKFDGGRPDLALSTNKTVAAIDQIRNESDIPDVEAWDEINDRAEKQLSDDYQGTYNALFKKASDVDQMSTVEIAAAKKIIARETLAGNIRSSADRVKIALLIHGYRDIGTEAARRLAIRRDPSMSPAERHAQYIAEALFTPDAETRKRLREAKKGQQEDILSGWMARVDAIKAELLSEGIDIDASLAAFKASQDAAKQSSADSPRATAAIEDEFRKLTKREKAVITMIRQGARMSAVMDSTQMSKSDILQIRNQFDSDIRKAMAARAKRYMANSLAASPSDMMDSILADLGWQTLEDFDDTVPGYVPPELRKPQRPRKPAPTPAPKRPDLTPEQQTALDEAFERFKEADPSTWSTFWQTEAKNLTPMIGQVAFEEFKGEAMKPWRDRWQTEMEGVATPAARISFDDWISKPSNAEKINRQEMLFPEPINEQKGDWNETRPFSGQGELMRESVNETTGTFNMNDPRAVKAVLDAYAIARGSKMDALMEYWRASILSGPQTHIVNAGSNLLNAAFNLIPKRAAEAAINSLLGTVGQGNARSATFAEFVPMARNLRAGFQLAARMALNSWNLQERTFEAYANAKPLQFEFTGVGSEHIPPALKGPLGKIMHSISFRPMTAVDEFMKSLYAQMEAAAQAHRIAAVEEKLTGDAYEKRLNELMVPGSAAWIRAIDEAKRITFQQEIDGTNPRSIARLDQLAELAKKGRNMPWIGRPLTFFLPFIDTPLNVFKQAVEMSPIGGTLAVIDGIRALRRRVFRGNLSPQEAKAEADRIYDRARFVQDLTNQTMGVIVILALQGLVEGDEDELPVITGTAPYKSTKRGERDNAYAVLPPQTIRIGDLQFSYARVEPFATFLASTVDLLVEMNRHGGFKPEVMSQWLGRFKDQVKDKTFLQGISDLINAVEDPDRFAERLTANIATGFVPNLIRQPIREADSQIRDNNPRADDGFMTAVSKRVGFSIAPQSAPEKMDVWGNDISSNRGVLIGGIRPTDMLFRILDPTNATFGSKPDPIDVWIYRWNQQAANSEDRIAIQPISDAVSGTVPGEKKSRQFALTVEEQHAANRTAGKAARAILGDGWETMPLEPLQAERINHVVRHAQQSERTRIRNEKIITVLKHGPGH